MQSLFSQWPGVVVAGAMAVLVAAAYLLAAPMGRDLSAQMAHAQLAESYWPELLSLRWYGGFNPLGYSVLSPPVMATVGRTSHDGTRLCNERGVFRCIVEGH